MGGVALGVATGSAGQDSSPRREAVKGRENRRSKRAIGDFFPPDGLYTC